MKLDERIIREEEKAVYELRSVYQSYGYQLYRMGKFEEYDLYAHNKEFLVSNEIITFTDTSGKLLALKPDVTLSIIKNSKDVPGGVQKLCYNESVYRISKASKEFREIMQTGVECIGNIGTFEIAETLLLALKSLEKISESYLLNVCSMPLVISLISELSNERHTREEVVRCLGQKNRNGILAACGSCTATALRLCALADIHGDYTTARNELSGLCDTDERRSALAQLDEIAAILQEAGYLDKVHLDFSIINDMNYYNGIVFQGYVEGLPSGVLSGGQYDNLMKKMGRRDGGIGFAVYLDLLQRYGEPGARFDAECLLCPEDGVSASVLSRAAEQLRNAGESVLVCACPPEGLSFKRKLRVTREGAIRA